MNRAKGLSLVEVMIVMAMTDPDGAKHSRHSMFVVPRDAEKDLHRRQLELIDGASDGRCVWLRDRESDNG